MQDTEEVIKNLKLKIKNKKRGRKSLSGSGTSPFIKVALAPEVKTLLDRLAAQEGLDTNSYIRIVLEEHVSENVRLIE